MPILEVREGTTLSDTEQINNIAISRMENVTGVERAVLRDHIAFLLDSNTRTQETWQGKRNPVRSWQAGAVAFLPQWSELKVDTDIPYNGTLIRLSESLFIDATADYIDFSKIDFRFEEVTSEFNSMLAAAIATIPLTIAEHRKWPLLVDSAALSFAVSIICALSPEATTVFANRKNGFNNLRKRRVVDFVEANIHRQMSVNELANVAAMSPFHFCRSFKSSVGVTPARYVAYRRVEAAKKMLRKTVVPLAVVAFSTGYVSQSHFTTSFRTIAGTTPAQYLSDMADTGDRRSRQRVPKAALFKKTDT